MTSSCFKTPFFMTKDILQSIGQVHTQTQSRWVSWSKAFPLVSRASVPVVPPVAHHTLCSEQRSHLAELAAHTHMGSESRAAGTRQALMTPGAEGYGSLMGLQKVWESWPDRLPFSLSPTLFGRSLPSCRHGWMSQTRPSCHKLWPGMVM